MNATTNTNGTAATANEVLAELGALTVDEAAQFLRVGRTKIYELIAAGELKTAKLGTRRVVLKGSAVELLARSVVE